jgi:hypothetical protein
VRGISKVFLTLTTTLTFTSAASHAQAQLKPTSPIFVVDVSTDLTKMAVVSGKTFNEALATAAIP